MDRRALVLGALAVIASPRALAQSAKRVRIAYLAGYSAEIDKPLISALLEGLREHGYVEGKNMVMDARHAAGQRDRLPALAAELAALRPDVFIVAAPGAARAVMKVAGNAPIVMANVQDPIASGLVSSLARPGGNITGMSDFHPASVTKRLELLKEAVPSVKRVGVLWVPSSETAARQLKDLQSAAPAVGVTIVGLPVDDAGDIEPALKTMKGERGAALLLLGDFLLTTHMRRIAARAIEYRLPAVYTTRSFADAGGLMAYGTDFPDLYRRSAKFVDKILKGAKPGDLPIEQPTKFELVVNLKTAKALGLTIPRSILLRADQVIE